MKGKLVVFSAFSLALLAGLYLFVFAKSDRARDSASFESPRVDPSVTSRSHAVPLEGEQAAEGAATGLPLGSNHVSGIVGKLRSEQLVAGEQLYIQALAARVCSGVHVGTSTPPAGLREFCDQDVGDWQDLSGRFSSLDPADPVGSAYEYAALLYEDADTVRSGGKAPGETGRLLDELESMAGRGNGIAALVAAETLQQVGHVAKDLSSASEKLGLRLSDSELIAAQVLAVRLSNCRTLGGCGENQLVTFESCLDHGSCASSATALEVWRRSHTPDQFRLAVELSSAGKQ